jgi:cytochrome P450
MSGVRSFVRSQGRRGVMALAGRRTIDLSRLDHVPPRLSWPLQREGMDPVPRLASVRTTEPVHRLTSFLGITVWMVTGPAEARAVLANEHDFSNDIRPYAGKRGSASDGDIGGLGFTDPPEHTRLRRLLTPQFTMRRLERLRPSIQDIVERRLDAMQSAGPDVDLVTEFAFPVPFLVICELLGLPDEDRSGLRELVSARFDVTHGGLGTFGAVSESRKYLIEATARQRQRPGDGLLGDIIRDQRDAISDFDLAGLADGVFTGGLETSASMLALGTAVLLDHRDDYAAIAQHPERVEPTMEELLRYLSVVQIAFPRFARRDLMVGEQRVRAGDVVVIHLAGANRAGDPSATSGSAETFDTERPRSSHLAFGHGFHRCVGAELARMELRAALPALARRFPDLAVARPREELDFRPLSIVYGVDSLPVRLRPGQDAAGPE